MGNILVTGAAGFIGCWTCEALLKRGDSVIGIDNFNDYYDVALKRDRVKRLGGKFKIFECDITDYKSLEKILSENEIAQICHLAAQAGVRYSLKNPFVYQNANALGTLNLLELCRHKKINSLICASSSSVYGNNKKIPFSETDPTDNPISVYAATKKSAELIAYTYHHLYQIDCTILRFFTVYGPWGRPDMSPILFAKAISEGRPIDVYNHGKMRRDFTYITDIVAGILAALDKNYSFETFNLGNSHSVELLYFIECIEKAVGKKAKLNLLPIQPGDLPETFADIAKSKKMLGFDPKVKIEDGIKEFAKWFKEYYKI